MNASSLTAIFTIRLNDPGMYNAFRASRPAGWTFALMQGFGIARFYFWCYEVIGARNRKNARNIYRQRSLKDRVFLGFIKSFLKSHRSAFDVYHWIYLMELVSLVPQYAILLAVYMLNVVQNNILIFSVIAVKGLLCLIIRFQVDSLMRSRYRNGK